MTPMKGNSAFDLNSDIANTPPKLTKKNSMNVSKLEV